MEINLFNIFKAFFKIGAILLGGGYVIVPVMNEELVKKRGWLSEEEVFDFYCVSQCLSGIIAINMAILTGSKLLKLKGALAALFAMALAPIITITCIALILDLIVELPFIESVFWGVNISVIILIYLALKDVWNKSITDSLSLFWFIFILALALLNVNPAVLIVVSVALGALMNLKQKGGLDE